MTCSQVETCSLYTLISIVVLTCVSQFVVLIGLESTSTESKSSDTPKRHESFKMYCTVVGNCRSWMHLTML